MLQMWIRERSDATLPHSRYARDVEFSPDSRSIRRTTGQERIATTTSNAEIVPRRNNHEIKFRQ